MMMCLTQKILCFRAALTRIRRNGGANLKDIPFSVYVPPFFFFFFSSYSVGSVTQRIKTIKIKEDLKHEFEKLWAQAATITTFDEV
jgi:hypothetical protein